MRRGARGLALVQALVMTVLMLFVASSILRLRFDAALDAASSVRRPSSDLTAQSALNDVNAAWALADAACSSNASLGVSCSYGGGVCSCSLDGGAKVTAKPAGAAWRLSVDLGLDAKGGSE